MNTVVPAAAGVLDVSSRRGKKGRIIRDGRSEVVKNTLLFLIVVQVRHLSKPIPESYNS